MADLSNKITDLLAQYKKTDNNINKLLLLLEPLDDIFKILLEKLLLSLDSGIIDYKKSVFEPLFVFVNNARTGPIEEKRLKYHKNCIAGAIIAVFIQKLYSIGEIALTIEKEKPEETEKAEIPEKIDDIMTEINKSIAIDPNVNKNNYIDNILNYIDKRKKIKKDLIDLTHNLEEKQKNAYAKNFLRINTIVENKIKENYQYFKSLKKSMPYQENNILKSLNLNNLTPILNVQTELLMKIFSTLQIALEQQKQINKDIFSLILEKRNLDGLLEKEKIVYNNFFIKKFDNKAVRNNLIKRTEKAFSREIHHYVKKLWSKNYGEN